MALGAAAHTARNAGCVQTDTDGKRRPMTIHPDKDAAVAALPPLAEDEAFASFCDSFAYGSRSDLLFKFLKRLPAAEAAEFLRGLLERLGDTIDDGDLERLLEHVYAWNVRAYSLDPMDEGDWSYPEGPFAALPAPLRELRVGLLTASGHFVAGDDPAPLGLQGATQAEVIPRIKDFLRAPPHLSAIPHATPRSELRVRHPGYDIRAVEKDANVALPLDRLAELAREGVIGEFVDPAYSFVGAAAQTPIINKLGPAWAAQLAAAGVQALLLVPV